MPTIPPNRPVSGPGIPGGPNPENPVKEIAYMIRLAFPWMPTTAAHNRAVMLQNSLELDAQIFPDCER